MNEGVSNDRTASADEVRADFQAMIGVVWWAVGLTLSSGVLSRQAGWLVFDLAKVGALAAGLVASSAVCVHYAPRVRQPLRLYFLAHLLNIIAVTATLHYVGGIAFGPGTLLYALIVVNGGIVGRRPAYILAIASTAAYALLGILELHDLWTPFPPLTPFDQARYGRQFPALVMFVGSVLLVSAAYTVRVTTLVGERRNQLLAAMDRHRRQLEQRDHERARVLAAMKRELDEQHRAVHDRHCGQHQFIHLLAHDLKNPLNSIHLNAAMAVGRYGRHVPAAVVELLERIRAKASDAEDKIVELMRLFRVVSAEETTGRIDLGTLVEGVLDQLRDQVLAKGATIEVDALPTLVAQPDKLRHVVQNLLENAIKYVRLHVGRVHVHGEAAEGVVTLVVDDNGIGIRDGYREAVFRPFWRAPAQDQMVDARPVDGTGVGLALVREIVEQHGGTVAAGTSPLGGARLEVRMPDLVPCAAARTDRPRATGDDDEPFDGPSIPILLVDDNPDFTDVLCWLLERGQPSFAVHAVGTGHQSLAFLERVGPYAEVPTPAFIVLDYGLPDVNAPDVLTRLAALVEVRSIPVLVLCTTDWPHEKAAALQAGATEFAIKPSSLDALRATVVAFWRQHVRNADVRQ